jgi:hypothetical protein
VEEEAAERLRGERAIGDGGCCGEKEDAGQARQWKAACGGRRHAGRRHAGEGPHFGWKSDVLASRILAQDFASRNSALPTNRGFNDRLLSPNSTSRSGGNSQSCGPLFLPESGFKPQINITT